MKRMLGEKQESGSVRRRRVLPHILLATLVSVFMILTGMMAVTRLKDGRAPALVPSHYAEYCTNDDNLPPEVTLIGEVEIVLMQGTEYVESGIDTADYCETASEVLGAVDTNTPGQYELTYKVTDERGNETTLTRNVTVVSGNRGVVYLTFDDGPGPYTAELLDILARHNVKATFFVTGAGDDALIAREYNEGHAIGLHTLSHNYAYIYQNMGAFFEDLYAVQERVRRVTGETSTLIRFPGGSSNTISALYDGGARIMSQLASEVERRGFTYFDWNISSGDAGDVTMSDQVYSNVVTALREGGVSVVLQHDIKGFSVAAVERIIEYGKANGWAFDKLTSTSFTAHHGINN